MTSWRSWRSCLIAHFGRTTELEPPWLVHPRSSAPTRLHLASIPVSRMSNERRIALFIDPTNADPGTAVRHVHRMNQRQLELIGISPEGSRIGRQEMLVHHHAVDPGKLDPQARSKSCAIQRPPCGSAHLPHLGSLTTRTLLRTSLKISMNVGNGTGALIGHVASDSVTLPISECPSRPRSPSC
jgi:hypothetical protein